MQHAFVNYGFSEGLGMSPICTSSGGHISAPPYSPLTTVTAGHHY